MLSTSSKNKNRDKDDDRAGSGLPDVRGWAIIGAFVITIMVLAMIAYNPNLLDNASFMQLVGTLFAGTILIVFTNLFGGTKSGAETNTALAKSLGTGSGAPAATPPKPAPVVVTPPAADPGPAVVQTVAPAGVEYRLTADAPDATGYVPTYKDGFTFSRVPATDTTIAVFDQHAPEVTA